MVDLMKTFMFSQDCPFILQLIQEIPWCLLLWASLPGFFFSHLQLFFCPFSPPLISSAMSLALAENPLSFIIRVRLHHIVVSEVT
jgi:hypothetical protein